ncbi:hypothetical protein G7Y89_g5364 [Cudoniella acicularis]|uniref:Heterokaryon incompatibility domain-containing protein n=1 Tax=Cudoniella acicularis TaxID=354080 RepID=A0A8H4RML8_9HELO|nr:hypothetical protein G7Y89_g5364 [Cudoniella acicularis]
MDSTKDMIDNASKLIADTITKFMPPFFRPPRYRDNDFISVPPVDENNLPDGNTYRTSALCISCQEFLRRSNMFFGSWFGFVPNLEIRLFRSSLGDLEASVLQHHCHLCTLVWWLLVRDRDPHLLESAMDRGVFLHIGDSWNEIQVRCDGLPLRTEDTMNLRESRNYNHQVYQPGHDFGANSEACSKLVHYWLEECNVKHVDCHAPNLTHWPTRLINVGTHDGLVPIHLSTTTGMKPTDVYCALSHRWDENVFQLTLKNKQEIMEKIDLKVLPKSFQNAILITRNLGISYLWIDSLCIIQDCKDDWAQEASTMADVYENSYCTIAAASNTVVNQKHHLETWNPLIYHACLVAGTVENGLYIKADLSGRSRCLSGTCDSSLLAHSALRTRGWVFQERLLSRRMLYSSDLEIFWVCLQGRASQYSRNGHDKAPIFGPSVKRLEWQRYRFIEQQRAYFESLRRGEHDPLERHKLWFGLVEAYSECQLTQETDKLVALSGIAQRVQEWTGWAYLAGLWKENLLYDLLWRLKGTPTHRKSTYIAPTWSWASVEGKITSKAISNSEPLGKAWVQVINASTVVYALDKMATGQVSGGSLTIRGRVIRAVDLVEYPPEFSWHMSTEDPRDSEDPWQMSSGERPKSSFTLRYTTYRGFFEDRVGWLYLDVAGLDIEKIFLVPFFGKIFEPYGYTNDDNKDFFTKPYKEERHEGIGLAIMKKAGGVLYQRVGVFKCISTPCYRNPVTWQKYGHEETILIE